MRRMKALALAAMLLPSGIAPAIGKDCAPGDTQISLNECAGTSVTEVEGSLNALYKSLMAQLSTKAKESLPSDRVLGHLGGSRLGRSDC
jgi:uncharacterized protein YecT (DUF1311 family)